MVKNPSVNVGDATGMGPYGRTESDITEAT